MEKPAVPQQPSEDDLQFDYIPPSNLVVPKDDEHKVSSKNTLQQSPTLPKNSSNAYQHSPQLLLSNQISNPQSLSNIQNPPFHAIQPITNINIQSQIQAALPQQQAGVGSSPSTGTFQNPSTSLQTNAFTIQTNNLQHQISPIPQIQISLQSGAQFSNIQANSSLQQQPQPISTQFSQSQLPRFTNIAQQQASLATNQNPPLQGHVINRPHLSSLQTSSVPSLSQSNALSQGSQHSLKQQNSQPANNGAHPFHNQLQPQQQQPQQQQPYSLSYQQQAQHHPLSLPQQQQLLQPQLTQQQQQLQVHQQQQQQSQRGVSSASLDPMSSKDSSASQKASSATNSLPVVQPPQPLDDTKRLMRLVEDLSKSQQGKQKPYEIEKEAKDLLLSYSNECICAILEQACLLAKHRKSAVVELQDIYLILVKQYAIELPGYPHVKDIYRNLPRHGHVLPAIPGGGYSSTLSVVNASNQRHQQQLEENKLAVQRGLKRKYSSKSNNEPAEKLTSEAS